MCRLVDQEIRETRRLVDQVAVEELIFSLVDVEGLLGEVERAVAEVAPGRARHLLGSVRTELEMDLRALREWAVLRGWERSLHADVRDGVAGALLALTEPRRTAKEVA